MSSDEPLFVLAILVEKPLKYPALLSKKRKGEDGILVLYYSRRLGWSWTNIQDLMKRAQVVDSCDSDIQALAHELSSLNGRPIQFLTKEDYDNQTIRT